MTSGIYSNIVMQMLRLVLIYLLYLNFKLKAQTMSVATMLWKLNIHLAKLQQRKWSQMQEPPLQRYLPELVKLVSAIHSELRI